ncbi:thiolase family protein [Gordonia soli]|uniref:Probable acetyl-CoA acetyltransferase n=1 Tax=Gordonia soli NBRC 108243 TaxID=1223545 RepID=M0QGL2_9ACTN|nr:acetyl-CoA C-acyltransferase [Gordonia soli]GAC67421.1 beta-ketoadipyl-CoA thiolase [Gordonia soli NBRC 108243]
MTEVFLVDGARTPQGRYGGALSGVRPDDLAATVVAEAVRRAGVPGDLVDEVILGAANQAGEDNRNVARMAVLLAGLPDSVPGYAVNRLCASGLTALATAATTIRAGEADIIVAGGVESMTRAPWVTGKPSKAWAKPGESYDTALGWRFTNPAFSRHDRDVTQVHGADGLTPDHRRVTLAMGETAEEVAVVEGITRAESDAFALRSQQRAAAAVDAGRFEEEIVPVQVPVGRGRTQQFDGDETPRRDTTAEKLAALPTIFRDGGIVTAGSSSPLTDGAAALVVASEAAVREHGLRVRGRIVGSASAGVAPNVMGLGPVPATQKVLARAGWSVDDLGAVELNEAFAAQSLGVIRQLKLDESIVNADGGAIALGHPLGASGARIVLTLLGRMEREGARRGLATLCVGVGQGVSMLIEAP